MQPALITTAGQTSTLAVVQSLGRHGIPVTVASHDRWGAASVSRYCTRTVRYADPFEGSHFDRALIGLLERERGSILFLSADDILLSLLSQFAYATELVTVPLPEPDRVSTAFNKFATYELARRLGLPVGRAWQVRSAADAVGLRELAPWPSVLKPSQSIFRAADGCLRHAAPVQYVLTSDDYDEMCRGLQFFGQQFVLQEFIPGFAIGVSGLFQNGRALALFAHRRVRETNPLGGPSAVAESIPLNDELRETTTSLMQALNWSGTAMVEYRHDVRDGRAKLLEINGRFWGSLPLAIRCGMDFPYWLYQLVNGQKPAVREVYPCGVRFAYPRGCLLHVLHILKGPPRGWPFGYPQRRELPDVLRDTWKWRPGALRQERDDPWPQVIDLATLPWTLLSRLVGSRQLGRVPGSTVRPPWADSNQMLP